MIAREVLLIKSYECAKILVRLPHEVCAASAMFDEQENVMFCYVSWTARAAGERILRDCGVSVNAMRLMQRSVSLAAPYVIVVPSTTIKPCPHCGKDVNPVDSERTGLINSSIAHFSCVMAASSKELVDFGIPLITELPVSEKSRAWLKRRQVKKFPVTPIK